jgi:hypothetical protein
MPGLVLTANGTRRIFRPDGKVVVADAAGVEREHGEWGSVLSPDTNRVHYEFDGAGEDFDVRYAFNERNQLVAVIPAAANGGADSAPFAFQGRLVIDDNRDIAYELFDDAGESTGETVIVHGQLSFTAGLDKLSIELAGGGCAEILGAGAAKDNLTVDRAAVAGQGGDLIRFDALTINSVDGADIPAEAIILFNGHWDVNDDGIVFQAGLNDGGVKVQFGARYKGVTAGLAYYARDGDQQIAFTIRGEHQYKGSKGGEGSVNWQVFLGHSRRRLEARAELGATLTDAQGRKLSIGGKFSFVKVGSNQQLDLALEAKYEMKGGELIFRADVTGGPSSLNYNLQLEGRYQVRGGQVNFLIELGKKGDQKSLSIDLNATFGNENSRGHLKAVLTKTPSGKTNVTVDFELSARWLNGKMVPLGDPKPLPV